MILHGLARVTPPVEPLLARTGIAPTVRAEELSVAEFCALAQALAAEEGA